MSENNGIFEINSTKFMIKRLNNVQINYQFIIK